MILPPGFRGAAFGGAAEGDGRVNDRIRLELAERYDIPADWAYVTQVHGRRVARVSVPGRHGEADALLTTTPGLTITVATADCVPLVLEGDAVAAVVHVGWRGAEAGIVEATLDAVRDAGLELRRAAVGPSIGPCCYEVGPEVAARFPEHGSTTTWSTPSVDLAAFVMSKLDAFDVWRDDRCTYTHHDLNSYRRNHTDLRQTTMAWIPQA